MAFCTRDIVCHCALYHIIRPQGSYGHQRATKAELTMPKNWNVQVFEAFQAAGWRFGLGRPSKSQARLSR